MCACKVVYVCLGYVNRYEFKRSGFMRVMSYVALLSLDVASSRRLEAYCAAEHGTGK